MQRKEELAWDVHPDLVLLRNDDLRDIRCVALEDADDAAIDVLSQPGALCVYRQGKQAALLYAGDEGFPGVSALEERLARLGLQAGMSGPFALAASARGCMLKAQIALETGRRAQPDGRLYLMDELCEAALVRAAALAFERQGFVRSDFCDAALARMACVDEEKDTQYVQSLDAYLSCGMDMKRAAQRLGVHRNTLAYRLERVQALFDLDLKDVSRCFELLFSLWLTRSLPQAAEPEPRAPYDRGRAQAALWRHVERAGRTATPEEEPFACALLCVSVGALDDEARAALLSRIADCADDSVALAFDEDVLLMALPPQEQAAFAERIRPVCAAAGCRIVATQAFASGRIDQRARLCRMALCAGGAPSTETRDWCSTLCFMVMERCMSLSPYVCEEVIRVMDDDAQKGTALSRSLYAYLLHFRDMKRAAQQLGMHRNTMEYHMRKIDALIGEHVDEGKRFMMMCTYKMLALPEISRYGL